VTSAGLFAAAGTDGFRQSGTALAFTPLVTSVPGAPFIIAAHTYIYWAGALFDFQKRASHPVFDDFQSAYL
jgi:hypothetical protein